ncbi:spore germination protein [Paenibacillus sp. Y412MC10]|uniref:spore germination protein n=1 Tax=Geobacillus sp. (strain Y412MC10) TaxID=481743 RepID=UPI000178992F|nr:spore germination protein [Paenibacillus sp. Y412MC10]ACX63886.1 GerA spore germination protein [Paenibacillus sp. Y412MC10]
MKTKQPGQTPEFLSTHLKENLETLSLLLNDPSDLTTKVLQVGGVSYTSAIVSLEGLSDQLLIKEQIIQPIQHNPEQYASSMKDVRHVLHEIENRMISLQITNRTRRWDEVIPVILSGDTILMLEGTDEVLLIKTRKWPGRSIEEPQTEALVRGPRVGFTESIYTNISLLRRHIREPNLTIDPHTIGRRSNQSLVVVYIKGLTNPELIEEVNRRLKSLDLDYAPESGMVEQWIEDSFLSPFPQILNTERPDKVTSALLQGKVAILLDGTPFVLLLPFTFISLLHSPEDYYERWSIGSLIRLLRLVAIGITLFLPALYIAILSFHPGMIPFKLVFSIAASREGVPFPAVIEALLMEVTLELLREAGIRLPKPIGQTIGIVGGLVIGEAAVQAGIVSPIMVIIVALTAISSFAIPSYSAGISFRMLRFAIMIAASFLGLYGIVLTFIMICIHLMRLHSFGIPYLSPIAPSVQHDWKDMFIRVPVTWLTLRPLFMKPQDIHRAKKR